MSVTERKIKLYITIFLARPIYASVTEEGSFILHGSDLNRGPLAPKAAVLPTKLSKQLGNVGPCLDINCLTL